MYVVGCIMLFILGYLAEREIWVNRFSCFWEYYNHPVMIIASVGLLLCFASFKFRSQFVNWCATSTFAIYLIHQNVYVVNVLEPQIARFCYSGGNLWIEVGMLLLCSMSCMFVCVLLDKPRRVMMVPAIKKISKWTQKIVETVSVKYLSE